MTSLEIKRYDSIRINNNIKNDNDVVREIPIIIMHNDNDISNNIEINNNNNSNTNGITTITTTTTNTTSPSVATTSYNTNNDNNTSNEHIFNDQVSLASSIDFLPDKYGFLRPYNPNLINNTLSKKNGKKYSTENLNNSDVSSITYSNKSSVYAMNDNSSLNQANYQNYANMKEIIQNTPVEYFSEKLPIEVVRSRELKWVEMLNNFDEWMNKRFLKVKQRCRKGIPQSMRSRAWLYLTNAVIYKTEMNKKHNENYYLKCLNSTSADPKCLDEIRRDLHRQFPSHELFHNSDRGANMLYNVLRAYSVHNPKVGYCQSQGPIAAVLVMHMPEEDAFWMLIRISDFYLKNYYNPDLESIQIDGQTLFLLFKSVNSSAYKLMKRNQIYPTLYMTEWFMCVFSRTLPWCTVLRVWDMFFCEGIKVLFRVGLYLLKCIFLNKIKFEQCLKMNQSDQLYGILSMLKDIDTNYLKEEILVKESCKFNISENDIKVKYERAKDEFKKHQRQNQVEQQQYKQQQQANKSKK